MPAYDVHQRTAELLGPAPCDCCRHVQRWGATGEAWRAFREYAKGASEAKWLLQPKQPRADIGEQLGLRVR